MAKSLLENKKIDFQICLDSLVRITGWGDEELAKALGCSKRTVTNLRNNPLSATGKLILLTQGLLEKKERERWL